MRISSRFSALAAAVVITGLGITGCATSGPDYSSNEAFAPAGSPQSLDLRVIKASALPGAGLIGGLDLTEDGTSLLAVRAPDVAAGIAGAVLRIDPATGAAEQVQPIGYDADYASKAASLPQVTHSWAIVAGPEGKTAIASGTRWGLITDLLRPADGGQNYTGLRTDESGSPITPVTGACWYEGTGDTAGGTLTADGSATLTRRLGHPVGPGDNRPIQVNMLAGPGLQVRDVQREIAEADGPAARPELTTDPSVLVGGLSDLDCLRAGQVEGLRAAGVHAGLRPNKGAAALGVIDRELAEGWFTGGHELVDAAVDDEVADGVHSTGRLVGQPVGAGPDRLDAVAVDTATGTAVAGLHLRGEGVPDDAQVRGLALSADGTRGWATVAGIDTLFEFEIVVD